MICPLCKEGELKFLQDCIAIFSVNDGKVVDREEINYLDDVWLECNICGQTSETNKKLNIVLKNILKKEG